LFADWDVSPGSIKFRKTPQDSGQHIQAKDVVGFSIVESKLQYESKSISIKYYFDTPISQTRNPIKSEYTGNIFLEVLMRSEKLTLYSFLDQRKEERYFIEKDNQFLELVNIDYQISSGEGNGTFRFHKAYYREQLKQLLSECPTLNTSNLAYTAKSIINLVKTYHTYCKVSFLSFEQKKVQDVTTFGFIFGGAYGVDLQILSRKKFNNRFVTIETGVSGNDGLFYFGLYGGTYFGISAVQPFIQMGCSTRGGFDAGAGVAYKKKTALELNTSLPSHTDPQPLYWVKLRLNF
jgi:hypothetical protein